MPSLRKQRVIEAVDAYLDEERGDIPDTVETQLSEIRNTLQRPTEDFLSPGQMEVKELTKGEPLDRYPSPYADTPSPGQREAQLAAQNQEG